MKRYFADLRHIPFGEPGSMDRFTPRKKALLLYELESPELLDILDDERFAYSDNGGSPDGNVLLPGLDGVDEDVAVRVVEAGYGEMVEVVEASDEAMVSLFGWDGGPLDWWREHDRDGLATLLKHEATGKGFRWAHYGAYGAEDSYWVYVQET